MPAVATVYSCLRLLQIAPDTAARAVGAAADVPGSLTKALAKPGCAQTLPRPAPFQTAGPARYTELAHTQTHCGLPPAGTPTLRYALPTRRALPPAVPQASPERCAINTRLTTSTPDA